MKSKLKSDSFHIIKTISGEISLDFSNQNISKQLTKLIKSKNIRRKNRRKIIIKEQKNLFQIQLKVLLIEDIFLKNMDWKKYHFIRELKHFIQMDNVEHFKKQLQKRKWEAKKGFQVLKKRGMEWK